jgi:hypothetical protein
MAKKRKKFWTPMKIIITFIIILGALFFIAKIVGFEFPFLSSSISNSPVPSGDGGIMGGVI